MSHQVGQGQNLIMGDGHGSLRYPNATAKASEIVFRAVLFAANQVWSACSSTRNVTCYKEDLLPLLRGGLSFYKAAPSDLNQTTHPPLGPSKPAIYHDSVGRMHMRMPAYSAGSKATDGQGYLTDPSEHLAILMWACGTFAETNAVVGIKCVNINHTAIF